MIPRVKTNEKMKKYLYSNSIAAHPYYLMRDSFEDRKTTGLFRLHILDVYTNRNKMREERKGAFLT